MIKKNKFIILIIFLGFIISVFLSVNNLVKYDKNITQDNGGSYHQMIKYDAYRYLSHGNEIKKQLKNGLNFFETGREHYTKYLPARIYAAYYYFLDIDLFEDSDETKIKVGNHLPYLVMQSLLYYLAIAFLYTVISKTINQKTSLFIIIFLCFEPTILQYHSSFWSESIFFSLQILLISLILKRDHSNLSLFFTGIFLTILSFQKEYSIFYIIPVMIYLRLTMNSFKYKKFIYLIIGFFLFQSVLGLNNYKRSGQFYIMTADSKINLHMDLVSKVMNKKFKNDKNEFHEIESKAVLQWIYKNSITLNKELIDHESKRFTKYRVALSEIDKIKFDNFIRNRTFDYFYEYPMDFIKYIIKSSIHIVLLNPFHIYSDHNFFSGEFYYLTETHDKLVLYRIIYTLIIYAICLYGLYFMIKKKEYNILIYLFFSIIYFYGLVSWHGNTRYFMPVVIYLSFFFGYGLIGITDFKKKN